LLLEKALTFIILGIMIQRRRKTTSWEGVNKWYKSLVGESGHHYHKNVIFPKLIPLLGIDKKSSLLDLACGNGVLSGQLPKETRYVGVDISPSLINEAKKLYRERTFHVGDITAPLPVKDTFTHAVILLALQNLEDPVQAFRNCAKHLEKGGTLAIVLNHPCFRIPRQSEWGVDEAKKMQYRRIDRYMSEMNIPIAANPSKGEKSVSTLSFHRPLSAYVRMLAESGFAVTALEEWCSDKESEGGRAKMENRARDEIPLFLAIKAIKIL